MLLYGVVFCHNMWYNRGMKLNYDKKSKDPTYFIQQGYRNGKKTSTRNVKRIGKHSELLAITDDPLAYAKEMVAKYNEELKSSKVSMDITIDFDEKIKATEDVVSASTLRNIGYYFIQQIYHDLDIASFFRDATKDLKITYDPNLISRFLVYDRILHPGSKRKSFLHQHQYYEEPQMDYFNILRSMDILEENYDRYIEHLYENSQKIVNRNTAVCYYDCTNFYFEIESPDEDYIDELTGEYVPGLRKYGFPKDHKPNPIVEMGLFVDGDGIPVSMCIVPGNQNEQTTAIPLEQKMIKMFGGKKFIYCSDAGLSSYHIRNFNSMGGRAFVVTQSIKKLSQQLQDAVFNDYDYKLLSCNKPVALGDMMSFDKTDEKNRALYDDRAYKIIPANNLLDLGLYEEKTYKNGKTKKVPVKGVLEQNLIVTYSRKAAEYQRRIRNNQVERAKAILKNKDPESVKKGPNDVTRFIKRISKGKSGETATDIFELNEDLIAEEAKYDGFYAVATNLTDDPASILAINGQRYIIEDCFRLMKTNLVSRPVYHHNPERIIAHFQLCYTALLIFRLLQKKLELANFHFTPDQIIETLQNMQVTDVNDLFYKSTYKGSKVLTALSTIYPLAGLDKQFYKVADLNKKFKKISK